MLSKTAVCSAYLPPSRQKNCTSQLSSCNLCLFTCHLPNKLLADEKDDILHLRKDLLVRVSDFFGKGISAMEILVQNQELVNIFNIRLSYSERIILVKDLPPKMNAFCAQQYQRVRTIHQMAMLTHKTVKQTITITIMGSTCPKLRDLSWLTIIL